MISRRDAIVCIGAAMGLLGSARMTEAQEPGSFPSRPPFGEGENGALTSASSWLRQGIARDVVSFALGEERRFDVDQTSRTMTLTFADHQRLAVHAEALGSFNPANHTFRWAWSNTSVDPHFARASDEVRTHADVRGFHSFSTPIFETTFDDCCGLAALAAKIAGCAGVYRAITEDHVSVFLGYSQPSDADVARIWRRGRASTNDVSEAQSEVIAYDAAMLPFDVEYDQRIGGDAHQAESESAERILEEISTRQRETHRRFWRRDDRYWDPALSWPSPHDPQSRTILLAAPRRAGGVYVVRGSGAFSREAFVLQRFPDGMRIVDCDLDWGSGLLLA